MIWSKKQLLVTPEYFEIRVELYGAIFIDADYFYINDYLFPISFSYS